MTRSDFRAYWGFTVNEDFGIVGVENDGKSITYVMGVYVGSLPSLQDAMLMVLKFMEVQALSGSRTSGDANNVARVCKFVFVDEVLTSTDCPLGEEESSE